MSFPRRRESICAGLSTAENRSSNPDTTICYLNAVFIDSRLRGNDIFMSLCSL
jgi:hypothetical protein